MNAVPSGVHPTATILGDVLLPEDARVGPGAVLQGPMSAGPGLRIEARGLVGGPAQHRRGDVGRLVLGRDVHVRECATIHRGSPAGAGVTRVGDRLELMAYAHVGHDGVLGDDVTLANGAQLGGHVHVGDGAVIGARAAIHQFVCVGAGAMVAAGALVSGDVPPWTMVAGDRARIVGPNAPPLRARFGPGAVGVLRRALRALWRDSRLRAGALDDLTPTPYLEDLGRFLRADRRRPICPRGWA